MRKKVFGRQFSRSKKAREALFKSLIKALILHGKIETTYAKAKAISGDIDRIVRLAKEGTVSSQRRISAYLSADRTLIEKFVKEVSPVFSERKSGFTKIVRLPSRKGDAAEVARIEWTDEIKEVSKVEKVSKVSKAKKQTKEKKVKKSKDHGPERLKGVEG